MANNTPEEFPTSLSYNEKMVCPVNSESGESFRPDGATLHLMLACYLRLLYIYQALTAALQQDAIYCANLGPRRVPSFFEIRLVLFVQLVTHLLGRLRQAVAAFSSQSDRGTEYAASALSPSAPYQIDNGDAGIGRVSVLETTITEDLQQLQRRLQNV